MATDSLFQNMLNEYKPEVLAKEELMQRDWMFQNVEKVNDWKGGSMIVPFEGAQATSVAFGELTAANDIAAYEYVRGSITFQPEMWGSLKFLHKDLMQHDGKVTESTFLKILPGQMENFMQYTKEVASQQLLNGSHFAKIKAGVSGELPASGVVGVTNIDRFVIGQKAVLDDNDSAQLTVYVKAIDLNKELVTLASSRGGAVVDVSAYTEAQVAKFYHPGVLVGGVATNKFFSLAEGLLSAANGGSASLYGVSKLAYPYLQAINVSGSTISATNILEKIFDAYTAVRSKARGNANKVLLSFKHLGSIMKIIEEQKGAFKVTATSTKASVYGWTEVEITSVKGTLTIVGIQEMDNEHIMLLDMASMKFFSNGLFKKRTAPDGKTYFEDRATTGYSYIVDMCLFGDLVLLAPSKNAIIHSIPAY